MQEREHVGSAWTAPVIVDRPADGRPVFVVGGRRYAEVPLGGDDAYRFLSELRLEMTGPDFRAFVDKHRADLSPAVRWRLGLGPLPVAPEVPDRTERARVKLRQLLVAA